MASRKTAACFALLRGKVYEAMENLEPNEGWNETSCVADSWKPLAERNDIFVKPAVWIFSIERVSSCEDHNALACYSHLHFLQKAALFLAWSFAGECPHVSWLHSSRERTGLDLDCNFNIHEACGSSLPQFSLFQPCAYPPKVVWAGGSFGCLLSWSLGTFGRGALGEESMELGNLKLWPRLVATCSPLSANLELIQRGWLQGWRCWADMGDDEVWDLSTLLVHWKLVNGLIVTRASIGCDGSDSRCQALESCNGSSMFLFTFAHLT